MGHLFGSSVVGNAVWPRFAAARAPDPTAGHCWPMLQEIVIQRQVWFSPCGASGSWCTQGFVWALPVSLEGMGFDSNAISPLLPSCWGFFLALDVGYLFLVGSNILLSMVVQQWVAILEFSQEKMSTHPSTLRSCLLEHSSTHQQKIELKIYWAWPHPSEQDPLSMILLHQEASISLSSLFIRGQTEWKPQSQKTNHVWSHGPQPCLT